MDQSRKNKVSLRGASSEEISRDALLAKVSQERELRSYVRRANAAALYIQRVWRRYIVTKKAALGFQEEWEGIINANAKSKSTSWISNSMLRSFFFFTRILSIQQQQIQTRDVHCMKICFKILLDSMNSNDPKCNFCSLAVATPIERRTWAYQTQNLIALCSFLLTECNKCYNRVKDIVIVTSLALRIAILLTDPKAWKCIAEDHFKDAESAGKAIVQFLGNHQSGYYLAIRRYITSLNKNTDNNILITTSAITLALRPFHVSRIETIGSEISTMQLALEEYVSLVLTIPWLIRSLPTVLIPALKHESVLSPSFHVLLISGDDFLTKISEIDDFEASTSSKVIPPVGWALANVISLVTLTDNEFVDPHGSNKHVFYVSYVKVMATLAKNFLDWLDHGENKDHRVKLETSIGETTGRPTMTAYLELLRPIYQQWHFGKLLAVSKRDSHVKADKSSLLNNHEGLGKLEMFDIACLYSYILRIFGYLNPVVGPLPVLSMLSFSPGFLVSLWNILESSLLPEKANSAEDIYDNVYTHKTVKASQNRKDLAYDKKQKQSNKEGVYKWTNVLNKLTGKSPAGRDYMNPADDQPGPSEVNKELSGDVWDIQLLRRGPQGISKDISCLLHLFCAAYSHLLFVLDDIEFYEKQVPFLLEHQRRVASVLNTLVYNGLLQGSGPEHRPLMDSAIRCLHLLYERDCRHAFCPPVLWLSSGRTSRPPIAVAARSHEVGSASTSSSIGSVITITPHVFPFEERVQMFREFISMDKVLRKMAGEVDEIGSRSIEIVVRRGYVVEDGFRQLNPLGSKLKSAIHVSFVNESGLPEAGLDYGGLSKEFLTDISKQAFAPEFGLFSQTPTSESLLIPNPSARHLENGIQMIEFLGRVVGKALYEGILLDYSFSHVFVQKLLGRYSFLDELSTLDPELYRNLIYVKHYDGDMSELSLDFTVTDESFGKRVVIELKPGGRDISVTNENKMQYIHAMADYKLNQQIVPFSNAFYRGLADLISPSWLRLFNAREFNQLLSGGVHDIDVDDLRKNTKYSGGYSESSHTIKIFWEVMKGFEPPERCMLLKFVTSCSRAPLLGFKYLQPTFTIHKVPCDTTLWAAIGGQDVDRLPSASTCYNTLKLPTYKRASRMREKLLYAITSNAGFELS